MDSIERTNNIAYICISGWEEEGKGKEQGRVKLNGTRRDRNHGQVIIKINELCMY